MHFFQYRGYRKHVESSIAVAFLGIYSKHQSYNIMHVQVCIHECVCVSVSLIV